MTDAEHLNLKRKWDLFILEAVLPKMVADFDVFCIGHIRRFVPGKLSVHMGHRWLRRSAHTRYRSRRSQ